MQFLTSLFGSDNTWLTAAFALGIVLVLIVLGLWLLKLVFGATTGVARGRNRRLSVVDSLALDPKRQLLIIRRDDVEHLVLTGGAHDLVIETGIAVPEAPAAQPTRRPIPMVAARKARGVEPAPPVTPPVEPVRPPAQPPRSLRHTGLLRPGESEPVSPEISAIPAQSRDDSVKEEAAQHRVEGRDFGDGTNDSSRN